MDSPALQAALRHMRALDGPFVFLARPGGWLWGAAAMGALVRLALAFGTSGTYDVEIWAGHAAAVETHGLIDTYLHGNKFNHPPLVGVALGKVWAFSQYTGISFAVLLRIPTALLDLLTGWLLLRLLPDAPHRYALAALYWLHPLAWILSGYHGNNDAAIATGIAGSLLLVTRGRPGWAGAVLGLALGVKLPAILAVPALGLAVPSWRGRLYFAAAAGGVAFLAYLPGLSQDPVAVVRAVLLYGGLNITTTGGERVWGLQVFYPDPAQLPFALRSAARDTIGFLYRWNAVLSLLPALALAWLRRDRRGPREVSVTIALGYIGFYGFTNAWSFQYFAWVLPFWLLLPVRAGLAVNLFGTAYIYLLYAYLCGSPLLLGSWDFVGHPHWPLWLRLLRNFTVLTFFVTSCWALLRSLLEARRPPPLRPS